MYEIYCKLRDEKGVKDSAVAKATGIGQSTFSDWKSGRSEPKKDKLEKIADYFHVPVSTFYEDEDEAAATKYMYTQMANRYLAYVLGIETNNIVAGLAQLNHDGLMEIQNRIDEMLCVPKYRKETTKDDRVFHSFDDENGMQKFDSFGRKIEE